MKPVLVLGIGNILLRDEGIGVRVVEAMRSMPLPADVELVDGGTGGADLLDLIADRKKIIVIDAMNSGDAAGSIRRLAPDDLARHDRPALSLHEFGLLETLRMARHMGCAPREVVVIGVRPETIDSGLELSAPVAAAIPRIIQAVRAELPRPAPAEPPA